MASRVLYSDEYDREIAQGTLAPETFDYRILCEGDSWMDRSSIFQLSLPWALAQTFHGTKGNDALFINLARFGDTLRGIADCGDALFDQWLDTDGLFRFDALLFSASGNDFVAAVLEPGSGNGILHGGARCAARPAGGRLLQRRRRRRPGHQRDRPQLRRDLPARAHQPQPRCSDPAELLQHAGGTTAVALLPAAAGSTGSSGDWLNEIHPNKSGWTRLAQAWQKELDAIL